MKGRFLEKVVLKEGWFMIRGSSTWKHEGKVSEKSGLERGVVHD